MAVSTDEHDTEAELRPREKQFLRDSFFAGTIEGFKAKGLLVGNIFHDVVRVRDNQDQRLVEVSVETGYPLQQGGYIEGTVAAQGRIKGKPHIDIRSCRP